MFPWQLECLTSPNVLQGGNLVYSAPTSAGKTLVAEILTLQTVLERKKKVIIILPFVSVVREKMLYFQDLMAGSGVRVEGFMGSYNPPGGFRAVHVAICTIEKANSLINRLLEENNFDNIGCVVVDELHLLGDPHRGYLLELLLTKLRYVCKKGLCSPIQIVGMSATLPNLTVLASWLDATLYQTDFRPIPLVEYLKVDRTIYKIPFLTSGNAFEPEFSIENDTGDVTYLCVDTIIKGYSVLVFCPTRNWCESLALQVAGEIKRLGSSNDELALELRKQLKSNAISDTLEQLKNSPVGLETVLGKCISFGVGFHHAGLTLDERDIIEECFKKNILRVLIATSTLSSGVNLPARRVIIRSPLFNGKLMDVLTYKQMIGRAGRMGRDTAGESFLLCTDESKSQAEQLVKSDLPVVESCLGKTDLSNSLKRAVLEVVASGLISSLNEIESYTNCTLLAAYENPETINQAVQMCINYLLTKGFIDIRNEVEISASPLAEACLSASMTPDQGLALLAELDRARKCFVLDSDLHAVYQVTPFSVSNQWSLDWMKAFSIWETLSNNVQKVGYMVGVEDRFLIKAMRGTMNFQCRSQTHKIAVHKRFFTALALQDLIDEVPLNKVADKYGCNKGLLQSLQQSASTFSAMVTNFCRKLGWGALEVVVSQLGQRIQFGAHRELLDLLRLESMSSAMARGLYDKDITSVAELARSTIKEVAVAIRKTLPYTGTNDGTSNSEKRDVYLPGRPGLTVLGAAELLLSNARTFLMRELGVERMEWSDNKISSNIYELPTIGVDSTNEKDLNSSLDLSISSADFGHLNQLDITKVGVCKLVESSSKRSHNDVGQINNQLNVDGLPNEMVPLCLGKELSGTELNNSNQNDDSSTLQNSDAVEGIKKQEEATEGEDDSCDTSTKFSSLLNISNPCIAKIGETSAESSLIDSDAEELGCEDNIVPDSQDEMTIVLNGTQKMRHKLNLTRSYESSSIRVKSVKAEHAKNQTDYNNFQISNFSKIFGDTFSNDSLLQGVDVTKFKRNINSSTPYKAHNDVRCDVNINNCHGNGSILPMLRKSVSLSNIALTRHPYDVNDLGCSSKPSPAGSELSEVDIFSDSRGFETRHISTHTACEVNQLQLIELDSNWGGDSLLMASQIVDSAQVDAQLEITTKRKLENDDERPSKKRCTNLEPSELLSTKTGVSSIFNETLTLNSQIIEATDINSVPLSLVPAENGVIEDISSPEIQSQLRPNTRFENKSSVNNRDSITDSYLAEAFLDSFKTSEKKTSMECVTPEMFESPVNGSSQGTDLFKTLSNTTSTVHENEVQLHHTSATMSMLCSPKNVSSPSESPSKYPTVGVSVVKCQNQSPLFRKSKRWRGKHNLSISRSTCKRTLISGNAPLIRSQDKDKVLQVNELTSIEPIIVGTKSVKILRKVKSESWGSHLENKQELDHREPQDPIVIGGLRDYAGHKSQSTVLNVIHVCRKDEGGFPISKLSSAIFQQKEVVFTVDTQKYSSETTTIGKNVMRSKICNNSKPDFLYNGIAVIGIYFHLDGKIFYCCLKNAECVCVKFLRLFFKREDVTIIGFDLPWQIKLLYQACGIEVKCNLWDVAVAEWLLNPQDGKCELKRLANEHLSPEDTSRANIQTSSVSSDLMLTLALKNKLQLQLHEHSLLEVFTRVEMPLRLLLVYMEVTGMAFDQTLATKLWNFVRETMSQLEEQIYSKSRRRFSLSSNKDLVKVKESLNIKSDDVDHPILTNVRNWRKLNSLKTRNLSQLLMVSLIEGRCQSQTSSFTVTGRITMHDPNLQHVPRDFTVGTEVFSLRSAFVAKPGNSIVSADYCQLELRILAHFSQDPELLSSFHSEADIFVSIAAKWNKIQEQQVTEEIRHQTKQIIYGIIYGMGDRALANALGVDPPEAAMLASKFRQSYPGIQQFIQTCISNCQKNGYISTLTGRIRKLRDINSANKSAKAQAERQAVNSTIQGSAADIAKSAAVRIESQLAALIPGRGPTITPLNASHLVLHLHDELVYEVSNQHTELVKKIVKTEMMNVAQLQVPLPIILKCGPSWGQLRKI